MKTNKFKVGETYKVESSLYTGTFKVISKRKGNLKDFIPNVKEVVTYEPLTGSLLEDDDYEFAVGSEFAKSCTLI